ncbi:hypothetical protein BGZ65_007007 [Modicella reniformis]|uniref:N-acetyltransferase domain-containing protein n=1 Tax=Modicella reniformis TaxID=1440133 RepID=A0A9P6JHQ0_9FUNG|nr:hypothetical protein BGZ65_007007 [Modicella reniformis]
MSISFFVVDPQHVDGTDLSLVPEASSESKPFIVIWRLVSTRDDHTPQGLYLPIDKTLLVDSLATLFPQLSTSYPTGPDLERIEACLARDETFTLLLATETTTHIQRAAEGMSLPRITLKITKIVGSLTLITLKLLMNTRAHIEDLIVSNDCRGQGVGRGLMQRAIQEAVEVRACRMVDLTSKPDRIQARALYESLGFKIKDTGAFRYYAPS